jgi:hypothetical protein
MTVTDFRAAEPNALVAMTIETARFWDLTLTTYGSIAGLRR